MYKKLSRDRLASYPGHMGKWPGIHCLRMRDRFRKSSANGSDYVQVTRVLCGETTKLDIRLAVCLRGDGLPETQGNDTTRTALQPPPVPPSVCLSSGRVS